MKAVHQAVLLCRRNVSDRRWRSADRVVRMDPDPDDEIAGDSPTS
jgi:hypothetical protein